MPLELGLFLGAKAFGAGLNAEKRCIILDREAYRYQKFCSDIAGQDIKSHDNRPARAIVIVRDWLRQWIRAPGARIPGGETIFKRYRAFQKILPEMCDVQGLDHRHLAYVDHHMLMVGWLQENPGPGLPQY